MKPGKHTSEYQTLIVFWFVTTLLLPPAMIVLCFHGLPGALVLAVAVGSQAYVLSRYISARSMLKAQEMATATGGGGEPAEDDEDRPPIGFRVASTLNSRADLGVEDEDE